MPDAPPSRSATPARTPRTGPTPGRELARIAVDAALGKKAVDVVAMDLRGLSGEVDYFVVCSGESDIQMRAIVDGIAQAIKEQTGERPSHREGRPGQNRWIVLDYFDLAVHVFDAEARAHYDLERLWGDAPSATATDADPEVAFLQPGADAGAPGRAEA